MEKEIFVFDFDGTLVDNMGIHAELAKEVITRYFGIDGETAVSEYLKTTGLPFEKQLLKIFPSSGQKTRDDCAREYNTRKITEVYKNLKSFPDTAEILKKISAQHLLFVTSGTEKGIVENWLRENGLSSLIKEIYGKEAGIKREHLDKIIAEHPENKITFVSDSPADMIMAGGKNIIRIGFLGNYGKDETDAMKSKRRLFTEKGAGEVISRLSELLPRI